jgi:single-strand DNA-binding protein
MSNFKDIGRIGRDAEVRQTNNGTSVANFPVAVNVGYGDNKATLWLDCSMFGKRAEGGLVQYLVKGAQVMVEGDINLRQYTKGDGTGGAAITLNIQDLKLAGGQPQGQQQPAQSQQAPRQQPQQQAANQPQQTQYQQNNPQQPTAGGRGPAPIDDFDDDIPFARLHWMEGG